MGSAECFECGHVNDGDARFCASCGVAMDEREVTTDHAVVHIDDIPGAVDVDRSAFGVHEGLFVVIQGAKAGARYALDTDLVTIGRHPRSDIFLDDITVSRRHAEVRRDGARYWVSDAGSLNGTYVNRELVDDIELSDGDELQVGKFKLVFVHGTSTE
jgi:pSer/pThr/pTyr-binding forkhead associated (FHA) protein